MTGLKGQWLVIERQYQQLADSAERAENKGETPKR
jgi:hypothetical protein